MKNNNLKINAPASTYRVQFHKEFTLQDLEQQVDYLHQLGVAAIYASPIFKATPGSAHGYDVTDPHVINPEIGDIEDLRRISAKLKAHNMLWIQDIVPNHMAFTPQNWRLIDVMQRGQYSEFHTYFDIDWDHPSQGLNGKLMAPFLGDELERCIDNREIQLAITKNGLKVVYYENEYPISISAFPFILNEAAGLAPDDRVKLLQETIQQIQRPMPIDDWQKIRYEYIEKLFNDNARKVLLEDILSVINQDSTKLRYILDQLSYVLTHWKRTEREINYRRFFTINGLICLRQENKEVFTEYHSFIKQLYDEKLIDGVRIDHIDGLNNPNEYLERLRELLGPECYIVAEKILEAKEDMPDHWPVQGESGYQFLASVSQLLTNRQGGNELLHFYRNLVSSVPSDYHQLVLDNKKNILESYMGGEWDNLSRYFMNLRLHSEYDYDTVKETLKAFMLCLPVYRIYPKSLPISHTSAEVLQETFEKAIRKFPEKQQELKYLQDLLTGESGQAEQVMQFLNRLMQFTGPLTAKGVEDTTFYVYNAMISHCEVGDSPATLGIAAKDFHDQMLKRAELAPLSMNGTATHDTKRGEDARIRLNVLSEMPALWEERVKEWIEMNRFFKKKSGNLEAPTRNDEYFIYQALIGGFPEDLKVTVDFIKRVQAYLVKVTREAKVNSNWEAPNEEYESACTDFVEKILSNDHAFLESFTSFQQKVLSYSKTYSLAQVLLKVTTPGIPDVYQGCELWDLSFVDPDNRRPVDYSRRSKILQELINKEKNGFDSLKETFEKHHTEGLEKLFVTWKSLTFRRENQKLFTQGKYTPLLTTRKGVTLAYAREYEEQAVLVAVPIGLSLYEPARSKPIETEIIIPETYRGRWKNILTGNYLEVPDRIQVHELFSELSVAMLAKE